MFWLPDSLSACAALLALGVALRSTRVLSRNDGKVRAVPRAAVAASERTQARGPGPP